MRRSLVSFRGPEDREITYYSWNFGDGNTSTEKDPVHTYRNAGEYGISLTVGGPSGSSSFGQQVTVRQRAAPVVRFDVSTAAGEAPLQVLFRNRTPAAKSTNIDGTFGDGHKQHRAGAKAYLSTKPALMM